MNTHDLSIPLNSEADTRKLASSLAKVARPGDNFLLYGEIGSGKSTFARAFIRYLCPGEHEIPSPTFTLVQTYSADLCDIWHFDFYRLLSQSDAIELGLDEALSDGITLIEWPNQIGFAPTQKSICIYLRQENEKHHATVHLSKSLVHQYTKAISQNA